MYELKTVLLEFGGGWPAVITMVWCAASVVVVSTWAAIGYRRETQRRAHERVGLVRMDKWLERGRDENSVLYRDFLSESEMNREVH